jgi:hypothetical protein
MVHADASSSTRLMGVSLPAVNVRLAYWISVRRVATMSPQSDMEMTLPNTATPEFRLQRLEDLLDEWKRQVFEDLEHTDDVDDAFRERFAHTGTRLLDLNEQLYPEDFDDAALAEIRDIILKGIKAATEVPEDRPLDRLDDFLVRAEAIRHIIRDALDGHVKGLADDDAKAIVESLRDQLPRLKQKDLAGLVGRSPRQVQRWARDGGPPTRRLLLVSRMVALLKRAWTEEGVVSWFDRPRGELDGKRPLDTLDDPAYEQRLMLAVRQGRAQHGS